MKGILKTGAGGDAQEELVCNVPEHHDLVASVPLRNILNRNVGENVKC